MKNILFVLLLMGFYQMGLSQSSTSCYTSLENSGLCPPPAYAPAFVPSDGPETGQGYPGAKHKCDLYTDTGSELIQECNGKVYKGVGPVGNAITWKLCIRLAIQGAHDFKYRIKMYKAPFSSDVSNWDSYTFVSQSALWEAENISANDFLEEWGTHIEYGYTYRAKITYKLRKHKKGNPWPLSWKEIETDTWNVYSCLPKSHFKINGKSTDEVSVNLDENFLMNVLSAKSCDNKYVISIQQSDESWNKFGPENLASLHENELNLYGGKSNFNLKLFNATFGTFDFKPGKFYRVKLAVGPPWTDRTVLLKINPCDPVVNCILNNASTTQVSALVTDPLILNFANTFSCTGDYFLEILPTDANWNGTGPANAQWLPESMISQFGGKGAFNLKQFNSSFGTFDFENNKYYRIKVAVSEPWTEGVALLHIYNPCTPGVAFALNGQTNNEVSVPQNHSLTLDFSGTVSCTGDYYISVLPADATWNGIGEENGQWLSASQLNQYGGKSAFDLKQFNSTFGNYTFEDGKYYRVKVAVSEPWTEAVTLLQITNPLDNTRRRNE